MSNEPDQDIHSCPFCNSAGRVNAGGCGMFASAVVYCQNSGCAIAGPPATIACFEEKISFDDALVLMSQRAIERWNKRLGHSS